MQKKYISDMIDRFWDTQQSWGVLGFDTATYNSGQTPAPLMIGDKEYKKGLGTQANSEIIVILDGEYETFQSDIGFQPIEDTFGSVIFEVYTDGEKRFDSGIIQRGDLGRSISVSVAGAKELRLVIGDAGDGTRGDIANWADARLIRKANEEEPETLTPETMGGRGDGAIGRTGASLQGRGENHRAYLEIAPFARVVTCDPTHIEGTKAGRLDEFPAEDLFPEMEILPSADGFYTIPTNEGGLGCIGLVWPERRFLTKVSLDFDGDVPADIKVEYWSSEGRMDDWSNIGQTIWQGKWETLPGTLEVVGKTASYRVSQDIPEFKGGLGTHKVRWILPGAARVIEVSALSRSTPRQCRFRIEMENPTPDKAEIDIYNGCLPNGSFTREWDLSESLDLDLTYTAFPRLPDRTVIRLRLPNGAFGIAVEDIIRNGCVYIPAFGVFATTGISLAEYKTRIQDRKTILQQVHESPDQTFDRSMEKLIDKKSINDPMLLSLPCDNNKFVTYRDGRVTLNSAPDDPNNCWGHSPMPLEMRPSFGSGEGLTFTRKLEDKWMPIPIVSTEENGIVYRERIYVAPFGDDSSTGLNDKPLGVTEFAIENTAKDARDTSLAFTFAKVVEKVESPIGEIREVSDGFVIEFEGSISVFINIKGITPLTAAVDGEKLTLSGKIEAGKSARCTVYFPRWNASAHEYAALRTDRNLVVETKAFWQMWLFGSMEVEIPEPLLQDVINANRVHALLCARNQDDGRLIAPWIAAVVYGPLDTEAQAVVLAMGLLGHEDFARRSHDFFLSRYNDKGMLANGYTLMGTGQHLWTLGECIKLTDDQDWVREHTDELARACRWIIAQHEKSRKLDPRGEKMPEYGFAPPGVMADWNRYAYYFSANGYYYAGLNAAARALDDLGHPEAKSFLQAADEYRQDILHGYRWNQARMPVLPLRDGTWVPAYPSSVYTPGLTRDFFKGMGGIGHDVEGGGHHLINHGVIDPESRDADWIVDYMEDNWFYLTSGLANYSKEQMEADWFTFGGFAKLQPFYLRYADICAARDNVKAFVRSYFNAFPPMLSTETLALWEHFHQTAAWNKTHESAWFLQQTRMMLLNERRNELWLAPFVTNNWMKDGMVVGVKNAPTFFGKVSYRIKSNISNGRITAEIEPPTRSTPEAIIIRLRHPEGKQMSEVLVNGKPHIDFDPDREIVHITPVGGKIKVEALFK